ncbi:unnamed protein product [Acanthosepion pharaonis]|uniref:Uncharacterized protein n=1 Tax=Acanthosepion pharaonis TaxID=158019 RepID=A0A812CDV7_ACAPH|nr:unnamed protein product [Sepia pharaonis]
MDSTEDYKKKMRESFGVFSWVTKAVVVVRPSVAVLGAVLLICCHKVFVHKKAFVSGSQEGVRFCVARSCFFFPVFSHSCCWGFCCSCCFSCRTGGEGGAATFPPFLTSIQAPRPAFSFVGATSVTAVAAAAAAAAAAGVSFVVNITIYLQFQPFATVSIRYPPPPPPPTRYRPYPSAYERRAPLPPLTGTSESMIPSLLSSLSPLSQYNHNNNSHNNNNSSSHHDLDPYIRPPPEYYERRREVLLRMPNRRGDWGE